MKKLLPALFLLLNVSLFAQVSIIPQPVSVTMPKVAGNFVITPKTRIVLEASGLVNSVNFLNDYLQEVYGFKLENGKEIHKGVPVIVLNFERMDNPLPGAYTMSVTKNQIYIAGDNEAGVFYGIQTLLQLLPAQDIFIKSTTLEIPFVNIKDYPRFAYRGMHLDVGRHFFPIEFVKRYIDYIAMHKMNYFHWHLTEDQGWRIEIKKYPRLTEVGAWRNTTIIGHHPGTGEDNMRHGGFYTQEEVKDVVKYAAERYITVVPEIEMPGHASAALASYPYLGCTGGPYKVQGQWGVFPEVYCAGNDSVFNFLQDVLDEVIPLFPGKYVHIGGDECPKDSWKVCPKCQKRKNDLGLKDEHELQSYFVQRMEKYINSKGKSMIGWDEILEGGLAPNAVVMSWRGEQGGIEAAKQNHDVIMTPTTYVYFDYSQTKKEDSLVIGGYLPLEKVYNYEPFPKELTGEQAKHILGAQANLWTEYVTNKAKVEYMIFPRMTALSEVLWSPKEKKNFKDFENRLQKQFNRYRMWGANFSTDYFKLRSAITPAKDNNGINWSLSSKNRWAFIYVNKKMDKDTTYNMRVGMAPDWKKDPDQSKGIMKDVYQKVHSDIYHFEYTKPLLIKKSGYYSVNLRTIHVDCDSMELFFRVNKATGKKITLSNEPSPNLPGQGGAFGLVNGVQSEKGSNSPDWLGWQGDDLDAVIDLGKPQSISSVNVHIMTANGSQPCKPQLMEVFKSANGKDFTSLGQTTDIIADTLRMGNMNVSFTPASTRYVKVFVKNLGIIPQGMRGSGNKAWLYADEIKID